MTMLSRTVFMVHKVLLTLLFVCSISFVSSQDLLNQTLDFIIEDLSIPEALMILSEASETEISFDPVLLDRNKIISLHEINVPISRVLQKCLKGQNVEYITLDNRIVIRNASFEPYSLSGYVLSEESGEAIANVLINNANGHSKVYSNEYGFYSIDIDQSNERLTFIRNNSALKTVDVFEKKERLDVDLSESKKGSTKDSLISALPSNQINNRSINNHHHAISVEPNILSEIESKNSLSFLNEPISSRAYWGGNYDHQAVYLDDIKLFRSSHAFNQYSSFNTRLVRHSKHHQEYIPSKFSGNLSAVDEIHTKMGSFKNLGVDLGLNNMLGNITVDFPLVRDKVSFLVSYRSSFQDPWRQGWIINDTKKLNFNETIHDLSDLYLKLNWKLKKKHLFQLSYFNQKDDLNNLYAHSASFVIGPFNDDIVVNFNDTTNIALNQNVAAFSWRYKANNKLFMKTTISVNKQDDQTLTNVYGRGQLNLSSAIYRVASRNIQRSKIEQTEARVDIDYFHNQKHHFRFGSQVDLRKISPGIVIQNQSLSPSPINQLAAFRDSIFNENTELRIYAEDVINLEKLTIQLGISFGGFATDEKYYFNAEPRIGLNYSLSEKSNLSGFFMMNKQYFHYLSYKDLLAPSDVLISANFNEPPESVMQQSVKYSQQIGSKAKLAISVFNKDFKSLSRWSDNEFSEANSGNINSNNWNKFITYFDQSVQGADINLLHNTKAIQTNFRLSANNTKETSASPSENESTENISYLFSSGINIAVNDRLTFGLNWLYKSGLSTDDYYSKNSSTILSFYNSESTSNNISNLEDYHRLDASFTYHLEKKNAQHEISLNVFNVYNQKNQVYYYNGSNTDSDNNTVVHGQPFFPSIGYQYTWRNLD